MNYTPGATGRRSKRTRIMLFLAALVIAILVLTGAFLVWRHERHQTPKYMPESVSVVAAVGKLYLLPTGEQPTVAAIQDKSKLSNQAFFKSAQNGDYLLMYSNARLALLYRKAINKLVNVGSISPSGGAASAANR